MGLEIHHPIISTLWEHEDRSKRKIRLPFVHQVFDIITYYLCKSMKILNIFDNKLIEGTNLSILFQPFWIYLIIIVDKLAGEHLFYVSNHNYLLDHWMIFLNHWLIYWNNVLILIWHFIISLFEFRSNRSPIFFTKVTFSILFSSYIVFRRTVIWSFFNLNLSIVDFWLVCLCWSNKSSLITIILLGCDLKFSVGHMMCSSSRYLFFSHPLVCQQNDSYFVGIQPLYHLELFPPFPSDIFLYI